MIAFEVKTDAEEIRSLADRLAGVVTPSQISEIGTEAAADLTRGHLYELARTRHRPALRQNFYLSAADSVVAEKAGDGQEVRVPKTGMALRYFGGEIRPSGRPSLATGKPILHLAIPVRGGEAEGRVPAEYSNLFFVNGRKGSGWSFLARKGPDGALERLFMLTEGPVRMAADPSVLPSEGEYAEAVRKAEEAGVEALLAAAAAKNKGKEGK